MFLLSCSLLLPFSTDGYYGIEELASVTDTSFAPYRTRTDIFLEILRGEILRGETMHVAWLEAV